MIIGALKKTYVFLFIRLLVVLLTVVPIYWISIQFVEKLSRFFNIYHKVFQLGYFMLGFMASYTIMHYIRAVLLFYVKAAHIAVLVKLIKDNGNDDSFNQIYYGFSSVFVNFGKVTLFGTADLLLKSGLKQIAEYLANTKLLEGIKDSTIGKLFGRSLADIILLSDEIVLSYVFFKQTDGKSGDIYKDIFEGIYLYATKGIQLLKQSFLTLIAVDIFSIAIMVITFFTMFGVHGIDIKLAFYIYIVLSTLKFVVLEPYQIVTLMREMYSITERVGDISEVDINLVKDLVNNSQDFSNLVNKLDVFEDLNFAEELKPVREVFLNGI